MPGPQGFERFNTAASDSRRDRMLDRLSGLLVRPVTGGSERRLLSASSPIRERLMLLAVMSVALVVAAYAGPGIAVSGSEGSARPGGESDETAGADQYAEEPRTSGEPGDPALKTSPPGTGEDRPQPGLASAPPSSAPGSGVSDVASGGSPASSGPGDDDAGSQSSSALFTPVSYNAETYCRTYERDARAKTTSNARAVFPLPEEYFDSYDDTWGAARPQGGHEGADLMSPTGTPQYAITDGTVVRLSGANANGWNRLGGYTVMIRASHSIGPIKKGDLFYYAHMDRESPLSVGAKVEAGDQVGVVGDTGYGPEGTRGKFPPHLHLGWYDTTGTTAQAPSGAMNPYPLLEWVKRNGGTASGGWGPEEASAEYCDYQERAAEELPAPGDHDLPPGVSSGSSADLDTGSSDPRPSPVIQQRFHSSHSRAGQEPPQQANAAKSSERRDSRPSGSTQSPGGGENESSSEESLGSSGDSERPAGSETVEPEPRPSTPAPPSRPAPEKGESKESPAPDSAPKPRPGTEPEEPRPDDSNSAGRGVISPVVFNDEDADGVRDAGESTLSGWLVDILRAGDGTFTTESGEAVRDLTAGIYRVSVEAAEGYERTTAGAERVRVEGREVYRPSFGFVELSEISVVSCAGDTDDGSCAGERDRAGNLDLQLLDERGRTVSEADTGRDGRHRFTGLRPGDYELTFTPRQEDSAGKPVSREITLAAGESLSVEIYEERPSPSEDQYSGEKSRKTSVEISRHPETEEEER